jgi:hypothetical protein
VLRHLFATMCAFAIPATAVSAEDVDFTARSNLPPAIIQILQSQTAYRIETRINPFYLQGDFDGDGWRDTAVLVSERSSGKKGAALVFKNGKLRVIGAGKDVGDGTEDLDWMDAWYVHPKGKVGGGAGDEPAPKLRGDAIMAIRTEAASGLIWWDGKRFRWYQQGD